MNKLFFFARSCPLNPSVLGLVLWCDRLSLFLKAADICAVPCSILLFAQVIDIPSGDRSIGLQEEGYILLGVIQDQC